MTKRAMVKKFRRETGADKKTAMDYLRKCGWNYERAIKYFKLSDALKAFGEAVRKLGETLPKIGETVKKLDETLPKIGETNKEESHERDEDRIDQREMQGMSETGTGDTGSDGDEEAQM